VKEDTVVIPDPRIRVTMVADRAYVTLSGEPFPYLERHAMLINAVNGIYKRETGRTFKLQNSVADFGGTKLTSKYRLILMNELVTFLDLFGGLQIGLSSHLAHLTTAKNLDGDWLEAFRGNSMGLSQQGFVPANGGYPGQARLLAYQNMMMVAHVFGHHFNAYEGLADEICVTEVLGVCLDHERTLMWKKFYNDNQPRFSDGTRDPAHNNRQRVRDNMTSRGF
jgi:hypothetical protein